MLTVNLSDAESLTSIQALVQQEGSDLNGEDLNAVTEEEGPSQEGSKDTDEPPGINASLTVLKNEMV